MAASQVSSLTLGKFLKIVSVGAVYNNLSEDSRMWDYIKKKKQGDTDGREMRFLLRSNYGAAAVGFVPVTGGDYPEASQSTINEGVVQFKDFALTVEVERTLIAKAMTDMGRYGEPLAEELRAKTIALSRILSASLYQDGTGIIGVIGGTPAISGGDLVITLNNTEGQRGFIGWFEDGDKIVITDTSGVLQAVTVSSGTVAYYKIEDKDRDKKQITLSPYDSSNVALTATNVNAVTTTDIIYRKGIYADSGTIHPASITLGTTDLGDVSSQWVGLEGLTKTDNSKVNDINLTGALKGTRRDAGGQPIDSQDFQKIMTQLMIRTGQGRYKYDAAMMAWEAYDALIESRETDRRFNSIQDNKRGTSQLGYVHGKHTLIFEGDEFCPKNRTYIPPGGDVMQFYGSEFEFVKPDGGAKFFLANASSGQGHARKIRAYMEGQGSIHCIHSAAIGVITNFAI